MFTRRFVLAGSLAAPFLAQPQPSRIGDAFADCRARLEALFPSSLDAARALGTACRMEGESPELLLQQICPSPEERRCLTCGPADEVRAMIDSKIRADYAHGRARPISGWVLSQTEIRLFAILAS